VLPARVTSFTPQENPNKLKKWLAGEAVKGIADALENGDPVDAA
jgi:hypothetical protein